MRISSTAQPISDSGRAAELNSTPLSMAVAAACLRLLLLRVLKEREGEVEKERRKDTKRIFVLGERRSKMKTYECLLKGRNNFLTQIPSQTL
jgi:hypothetical protein